MLFSIIQKNCGIDFSENVEVRSSFRTMQQPTSTPLGLQDSEHGAALAKIQGSLQASQIPRASPAPCRNPPQVDSESSEEKKTNVKNKRPEFSKFQHVCESSAVI